MTEWMSKDEICELLEVSARTLDRRVEAGTVERRDDPEDARHGQYRVADVPDAPMASLEDSARAYLAETRSDKRDWKAKWLEPAIAGGAKRGEYTAAVAKLAGEIADQQAKERREKRLAELASYSDYVPHFEMADQAEIAEKLAESIAKESEEPPAYDIGSLWRYNPTRGIWEEFDDSQASARITGWSRRAYVGSLDAEKIKRLAVNGTKTAVELAQDMCHRWGQHEGFFEGGRQGVSFTDRYVYVEREGRGWRISDCALSSENRARHGYDFPLDRGNPKPAPQWHAFLESLFEGAEDASKRRALLQEACGVALMGLGPQYQRATVLYGDGGTGKGTFLDILQAAFPQNAITSINPQEWSDQRMLASFVRSRLNVVNEMSTEDLRNTGAVKSVIVGDTMSARDVFKSAITFKPQAGHFFTANTDQLPQVPGADDAFWDRWQIIPFDNKFRDTDQQDRSIAKRIIEEELHGVINWIIDGAQRAINRGRYTECPSGQEALRAWKAAADSVSLFYHEATESVVDVSSYRNLPRSSEVYEIYTWWAKKNGFRPGSSRTFGIRSAALGLRERSDGARIRARIKKELHDQFEWDTQTRNGQGSFP